VLANCLVKAIIIKLIEVKGIELVFEFLLKLGNLVRVRQLSLSSVV
jgi:hypothetical protein